MKILHSTKNDDDGAAAAISASATNANANDVAASASAGSYARSSLWKEKYSLGRDSINATAFSTYVNC